MPINCKLWSGVHGEVGACAKGFLAGKTTPLGTCDKCDARDPVDPRKLVYITILPPKPIVQQKRPLPTPKMLISFTEARLTAAVVPLDVLQERAATCESCPHVRNDKNGRWCSKCGCGLSFDAKAVMNLARYAENLPQVPGFNRLMERWGCKHPKRKFGDKYDGNGWRR